MILQLPKAIWHMATHQETIQNLDFEAEDKSTEVNFLTFSFIWMDDQDNNYLKVQLRCHFLKA